MALTTTALASNTPPLYIRTLGQRSFNKYGRSFCLLWDPENGSDWFGWLLDSKIQKLLAKLCVLCLIDSNSRTRRVLIQRCVVDFYSWYVKCKRRSFWWQVLRYLKCETSIARSSIDVRDALGVDTSSVTSLADSWLG